MEIKLKTLAGSFAENKDIAKDIRLKQIMPALEKREKVIVDFTGVDGATQSFIHAMISDPIRKYRDSAF
ncbi:STAS-like domain-containing protein, partial [Candidatus Saccharibacteria bacterium]|nr:STAS-like domain-containing protein [Candidatus Saccharibacteria bacterium]